MSEDSNPWFAITMGLLGFVLSFGATTVVLPSAAQAQVQVVQAPAQPPPPPVPTPPPVGGCAL